jgi:hypothetical protein
MNLIIIGIEPEKSPGSQTPLSPQGLLWGELAWIMNCTPNRFKAQTDGINLHPTSLLPSGWDSSSAVNLLGLLRGRRVILLGSRVSEAFGLGNRPEYLRWNRVNGGVQATLPHPQIDDLWWGEGENQMKAQEFLKRALRPCVHVEGPEGSGKSRMANSLARRLGLDLRPTQNPPATWSECEKRIRIRIEPGIVCDRSSGLVSELVYGPILRGKTVCPEPVLWSIVRETLHSVTYIYCRPPYVSMAPTVREGEDPDHVKACREESENLVCRYDEVFTRITQMGGRVIRYDWTSDQTNEEVARCVEY